MKIFDARGYLTFSVFKDSAFNSLHDRICLQNSLGGGGSKPILSHPSSVGILTKLKLIQALIVVLIVCKNEEDPFKIESTRVVPTFLPL